MSIAGQPKQARKPLSLCFFVTDLPLNDETKQDIDAILGIAQHFASCGDTVTLLWCPWPHELESLGEDGLKALKEAYFENHLIYLETLPDSKELMPTWVSRDKQSILALHYLQKHTFDIVVFAIEQGIGYYSIVAKETGLGFENTPFITVAQSPLLWRSEVDKFFIGNKNDVTVAYMEKHCAENADCLVVSSKYLKKWMTHNKWNLPTDTRIIGALRPHSWRDESFATPIDRSKHPIEELVIVSPTDYHDGLFLLCDALDELSRSFKGNLTITYLGVLGKILGEHTGGMLLRRARKWNFHLNILPRMAIEEALAYIRTRNCALVIPNLSTSTNLLTIFCAEEGIPLVATNAGSLPEHVSVKPKQKNRLCEPEAAALTNQIAIQLKKGGAGFEPTSLIHQARNDWNELVADKKITEPKKLGQHSRKLVSIVLVHHDRPKMLLDAVDAVRAQDYDNIELILVDDGSKKTEALEALKSLEADFKKRKWKIIREKNQYLGAARNCGVRKAKGDYILFIDDDNALFKSAVTHYVRAIENSGADICTSFQRIFYQDSAPKNEDMGYIQYFTLGGSLDLGFINNEFGDANSIIRKETFKKIGYVKELKSGGGEDWEFFARAVMNGLKLRVIPKPLYWYRTSPGGMFRKSHWYDTHKLIMDSYKEGGYKGLDLLYHLVLANQVGIWEQEGQKDNLRFSKSDELFLKLSELDPNSDDALELLSNAAAREGRPGTAISILGRTSRPEFMPNARKLFQFRPDWEKASEAVGAAYKAHNLFEPDKYQNFQLVDTYQPSGVSEIYTEGSDRLYMISNLETPSVAILPGGCPAGTLSVHLNVSLDEDITRKTDFLVLLTAPDADPMEQIRKAGKSSSAGSSGWVSLSVPHEGKKISAFLVYPSTSPMNVVIAMRTSSNGDKNPVSGCFSHIEYITAHSADNRHLPRTKPPSNLMRSRAWTTEEMNYVWLTTDYPSELPLLLIDPNKGIYLRPSSRGVVIAALDKIIPPFVTAIRAQVEIANEDAGPFEFAIAAYLPERAPDWKDELPDKHAGFSGWMKVEDSFRLHDLAARIDQVSRSRLSLHLAIRLADGSKANPASSYFRKLLFSWGDQ